MLTRALSRLLTRDLYMGVRKEIFKDIRGESRIEFLNVSPATLPYFDGQELRARLLSFLPSNYYIDLATSVPSRGLHQSVISHEHVNTSRAVASTTHALSSRSQLHFGRLEVLCQPERS